jgi:hypothetical protein
MSVTNLELVRELLDLSFKANLSRPIALPEPKTFDINERGPIRETDPQLLFGIRGQNAAWLLVA